MSDVESYIYLPLLEELNYIPSERYAHAPEILAHARQIAKTYGLYAGALFHTIVKSATWNAGASRWMVTTNRGDLLRARFLVVSVGFLSAPKIPAIPGFESYRGHSFHTSRWDYEYTGGDCESDLIKLRDKVVGIIGTGATAVQCIPRLGRSAKRLYVFQRTPSTVAARGNRPTDPRWAAGLEPGWQRQRMRNFTLLASGNASTDNDLVGDGWTTIWGAVLADPESDYEKMAMIRARVENTVRDSTVAEALKPWYSYLCRRPCFHDEYLSTYNLPTVSLVDAPAGIDRMVEHGLVAAGAEYKLDCVIYSTGFESEAADFRRQSGFDIIGRGGLSLAAKWANGYLTLYGLVTRGFPNLLLMPAPGMQSAGSVNYMHVIVENSEHVAYILAELTRRSVSWFDVEARAEEEWVEGIVEKSRIPVDFLAACTPSRINYEGSVESANPRRGIYGGSHAKSVEWFNLMASWRACRLLPGLELAPPRSS
jgi:cyclohexanone monooxygenase